MKIEAKDEAGKYEKTNQKLNEIMEETSKVMVGQEEIIENVLISILCDGNVLLESYPGLGKTKMIHTLSEVLGLEFSRIQNTPDLMPSDITGTQIINEKEDGSKEFVFQQGPIFSNMVLADEINRATPKTQAALLEAMQEKQVTAGNKSYELDEPFFLMATQNPIDQEGSLHPEETLYMNGKLWKAKGALEHAKENGEKIHEKDGTALYDAGSTTQSLNPEATVTKLDCMVYEKEYDGKLYSFQTKTGREIKVSGNHPFLVNKAGEISWVKARNLEEDDYLVSPEKLEHEEEEFQSHKQTLKQLHRKHNSVSRDQVRRLKQKFDSDKEELSRKRIDDLRIAAKLSKKELAEEVEASYDQVLNFLNGSENNAKQQILSALEDEEIVEADYFESFKVHRLSREPTNSEAGFLIGFAKAEGTITDNNISIWQNNLEGKIEEWISIAEDLGLDVSIREKNGCKEAKIRSKPFINYLQERYSLENLDRVLDAPKEFKSAFLEIFLLTESHYDRDQGRITFTQKEKRTVNVISNLLLQFGINSWIYDEDRVYRLKIQGEDLKKYLEEFEWRGEEPEIESTDSAHRTVPLDSQKAERLVELLGVRNEGDMSSNSWYNSYTYLRNRRDRMAKDHFKNFIKDMEERIEKRKGLDIEKNIQKTAKSCGLAMTDVAENTSMSQYKVVQAYQSETESREATEYISERYQERIEEAESILNHLKKFLQNDVFYDRIDKIEEQNYSGKVIGLAVPGNHNYMAGLGSCGINHNTYPLPEAQTDRFMMKLRLDYPKNDEEIEIVDRFTSELDFSPDLDTVLSEASLIKLQQFTRQVPIADDIRKRAVDIVKSTRTHDDLNYGASPRASMALVLAGKGRALMEGRNYVSAEDINQMAQPVLRHRLGLNFKAEKEEKEPDDIIDEIVEEV